MKALPQPTERELRGLLMLRNSEGYEVVMEYLGRCADVMDRDNRWTVNDILLRQIQGRTQAIEDIAEILTNGEIMLVDIRAKQGMNEAAGSVL